jgi:hypothetical protein
MKPSRDIEPMTLGNMRSLGVNSVAAFCGCGRESLVDVSSLPDGVAVPDVRTRLRCSSCGARPDQTRPNWIDYRPPGSGQR